MWLPERGGRRLKIVSRQVVCLGILYGLKAIKETSVVFPFFMASLAIIRKVWGKTC